MSASLTRSLQDTCCNQSAPSFVSRPTTLVLSGIQFVYCQGVFTRSSGRNTKGSLYRTRVNRGIIERTSSVTDSQPIAVTDSIREFASVSFLNLCGSEKSKRTTCRWEDFWWMSISSGCFVLAEISKGDADVAFLRLLKGAEMSPF